MIQSHYRNIHLQSRKQLSNRNILNVYKARQKLLDCGNIVNLCTPTLWVSTVPFRVWIPGPVPLPCQTHLWNSCNIGLPSTACNSTWISAIYLNLHPSYWIFVLKNKKTLQRNLLSFLGTILQVLVYVSFVTGHHSADRAQIFQQSASCLNLQLKCISTHCTIGLTKLMDGLMHFFHILTSPTSQLVTWTFQILNWSLANFDMWLPFKGFCPTHTESLKKDLWATQMFFTPTFLILTYFLLCSTLVHSTVKPVLNGISRDQNIFPLKPGFRLIKVHYIQYKKLNQDTQTLTLRWLMSYIYGAPILDVSRSHTTTQHSR